MEVKYTLTRKTKGRNDNNVCDRKRSPKEVKCLISLFPKNCNVLSMCLYDKRKLRKSQPLQLQFSGAYAS